jgi:hypothetical protein
MGVTLWSGPPSPASVSSGTAVTAAALTAGTPAPAMVIPAGMIDFGTKLRLEAELEVTSTSATPTLITGFYMGAVGGAIGSAAVLGVTSALAISATATAWLVRVRYIGTFRALGTSGSIHGNGIAESWANVGLTGAGVVNPLPITAALRTVTVNTVQVNQLDVGITLSSTTGTPSVTVTDFAAELVG